MAGFSASEWIARPSEEVFAFVSEGGNAPRWLKGVRSREPLTEGPPRLGHRSRETREIAGETITTEVEVTAFEPGRRFALTAQAMGIEGTYDYAFTPERGGTRVDLACRLRGVTFQGKILVTTAARRAEMHDGDQLRALRAALEGGP